MTEKPIMVNIAIRPFFVCLAQLADYSEQLGKANTISMDT